MPEKKFYPSIGELYGKITVSGEEFAEGERRLVREPDHPYVVLCKRLYAFSPSLGKGGSFSPENSSAIAFLKWRLSKEELTAASKIVLLASFLSAFLIGSLFIFIEPLNGFLELLSGGGVTGLLYAFMPPLLCAALLVNFFQSFPAREARREQTRALTYVPEILGYMIMSIKLVPNLEKAVEFAAQHGKGKIARDFNDLIWNVQIGVYNSLSEGLDALAYQWGKYSEEFKRSMMRIRASVIETTEAKRYALLDQTMSEMLESIKNKMEQYARDLSQPSSMLFYIGVLLPLLLIIILPVGSSFSGAPLANPVVLFLVYNVLIPLVTVVFAYNLLQNRPPSWAPPVIPDDYEGLPPKWRARVSGFEFDVRAAALLVLILGTFISFAVSTQGIPPKAFYGPLGLPGKTPPVSPADQQKADALLAAGKPATYFAPDESGRRLGELVEQGLRSASEGETQEVIEKARVQVKAEEQLFFSQSENDVAPYLLVFGLLITFSLSLYVFLHYSSIYKRKAQIVVQEMESEFKDSLYVIASRMGENKPLEEALRHVTEFLPDSRIAKTVFAKTLDNIKLLGMPLNDAVFDRNSGSVSRIPSTVIAGSMRMLVDSVQLGVNVAARTMISLSIQLQNAEKVNRALKVLVSDVTGTMKTMTMFIAPIVLGITTSLQRIVIVTISSIASSNILQSAQQPIEGAGGAFSGLSASGFIKPESIANIATPTQFILIVALYIVELVFIMTYFTTKIEEDNDLLVKLNIGSFMPIAIVMFVVSMVLSNILVGAI